MSMHPSEPLLRRDRLPHILCEGCGDGIIVNALLEAIVELGLPREKLVFVSGIGCSSRIPGYLLFDSLHTTHGRPIAFATGIKLANPELKVIVITGDGDMASIGGNHFLHAARRNIDMTVICSNNYTYGMTGGQVSPTTPRGWRTTTSPYGNVEPPMDIARVAAAAGANYVARWSTASPLQIKESIKEALTKEGFTLVEVLTQCPTALGRRNKLRTAVDMLRWYKENTIALHHAQELEEKGVDLSAKVVVGEFVDRDKPGLVRLLGLVKEEEKKEEKEELPEEERRVRRREEEERLREARKRILEAIAKLGSPKIRRMIELGGDIDKIEKELVKDEG